ncbi:hypothetical protein ACTXT7_004576 [Hymenolepis weldensis]
MCPQAFPLLVNSLLSVGFAMNQETPKSLCDEVSAANRGKNVTVRINGHEVRLQLGSVSDITLTSQETWGFGQTSTDLFKILVDISALL